MYGGFSNFDTWEVVLILENNENTDRWLHGWHRKFMEEKERGTFSRAKARTAVSKYLIPVAQGKKRAGMKVAHGADPRIDPAKVNRDEIVDYILTIGD